MSNVREIVNGSMLLAHINKKVSLTGFVKEKAPNGLWFEMKTPDDKIVRVTVKTPIDSQLEGYVEVHGVSTGNGIIADEYLVFTNEYFNAITYNAVCRLLQTVPYMWKTS
nr:uncharacterized protein LOC111509394 [Leptinotarsa decemlineata]